jgi:hypothetical protein
MKLRVAYYIQHASGAGRPVDQFDAANQLGETGYTIEFCSDFDQRDTTNRLVQVNPQMAIGDDF